MSNETTLDDVLALLDQRTDGDYLSRLANGQSIATQCCQFLRAKGPEIKAAMEDARRWNEWCQRHPILTYRELTGGCLNGAPYQPEKINSAMDRVIAAGAYDYSAIDAMTAGEDAK